MQREQRAHALCREIGLRDQPGRIGLRQEAGEVTPG